MKTSEFVALAQELGPCDVWVNPTLKHETVQDWINHGILDHLEMFVQWIFRWRHLAARFVFYKGDTADPARVAQFRQHLGAVVWDWIKEHGH